MKVPHWCRGVGVAPALRLVGTVGLAGWVGCVGVVSVTGCNDKTAAPPAAATAPARVSRPAPTPKAAPPVAAEKPPVAPAATKPTAENAEIAASAMEHDPNATQSVTPVDLAGKAPPDAPVVGKLQAALAWTDKYGRGALVIGKTQHDKPERITAMLVANLLRWEGDAWTTERQFKERIADCAFDVTLKPFTGSWSITDLDKNGIAEVTFAYHTGCRSDVSPITHKVLMTTSDKAGATVKYALRGYTRVLGEGGNFKADPAFKQAPAAFLDHAAKVWAATVTEKM